MDEPTHYVAESYVAASDAAGGATDRAAAAAAALSRRGRAVRHVLSIAAPEEELCLHLFEAASRELVAEVAAEAELAFDRVWAAIPLTPLERRNP